MVQKALGARRQRSYNDAQDSLGGQEAAGRERIVKPSFHHGASGGPGNYPLAPVYVVDTAVMIPAILLGPVRGLGCQYFKDVKC